MKIRRKWRTLVILAVFFGSFVICLHLYSEGGGNAEIKEESYHDWYLLTEPLSNSEACDNNTHLVILVHSAAGHASLRETLRNTWAGTSHFAGRRIKTVFLIASSPKHDVALRKESERHRDIVFGTFLDTYRNLTYKHVLGLRWAARFCAQAHFVLKMDDDIYVDVFQLVRRLGNIGSLSGGVIMGYIQRDMPVVRDPTSKWYVSPQEYPASTFPMFCSGWAYVTTPSSARLLGETASNMTFFWVDDVFVTGMAAQRAGMTLLGINDWFTLDTLALEDWLVSNSSLQWRYVFAPTWGSEDLIRRAFLRSIRCSTSPRCACCYQKSTTPRPTTPFKMRPHTGKAVLLT